MKIYTDIPNVEYWYDRHYRTWYARRIDGDGHQVSDAIDSYTKIEIIRQARLLSTEE